MSLLTKQNRITVKQFAAVPALLNLPAFQRAPASVSNVSSFRGDDGGINLSEGCLVTKTIKYTHQLAHWVNAVRGGDPSDVEDLIEDLCIIPYEDFRLNQLCNLAFLESFLHTSLDLYAFVAVTASSSALDELIAMVRSDNDRRQRQLDNVGVVFRRSLNFNANSFLDPEYELVALHPEHFIPGGSPLTVYDATTSTYKNYVAASDQCLRESHDPNSPRFPTFRHHSPSRDYPKNLNVFLVIINAEIKFRRYFEMIRLQPAPTPLPNDVLSLMRRTMELVDLIYWKPAPTKGSSGEAIVADEITNRRRNRDRFARPDPAKGIERGSSEEQEEEEEDRPRTATTSSHRKRLRWLADVDLETRRAYGTAIMGGHDRDYDPALFEDTFPTNYVHLYSQQVNVQAWTQGVCG